MSYFKINDIDFSYCVNQLKVNTTANYNAQTNAAGDTVVDYINHKRSFEVGIIPIDDIDMAKLKNELNKFNVSISFRNPETNELETNVNCIIPTDAVEYFTIRANRVLYKQFTLTFTEL